LARDRRRSQFDLCRSAVEYLPKRHERGAPMAERFYVADRHQRRGALC